jgi:hypothetical protein
VKTNPTSRIAHCALCFSFLWSLPSFAQPSSTDDARLLERLSALEKRVDQLERAIAWLAQSRSDPRVAALQAKASERMRKDSVVFTPEQMKQIENMYQTGSRAKTGPEAEKAFLQLIEQFPKSNRAGCALLYLGQFTDPERAEGFLKKAIDASSDCWYGDGVQVGAYARYRLARLYQQVAKQAESAALFAELRANFPDSIDHDGRLLVELIDFLPNKP